MSDLPSEPVDLRDFGLPYKDDDEFVRGQKLKILLTLVMLLIALLSNGGRLP